MPRFHPARLDPRPLALALLCACALQASAAETSALDITLIAASCANCHGTDGRGSLDIPALRGQSADHLQRRMLDFQSGKASDATVMTRLMKGYAPEEISALAAWFSDKEAQQ